MKSELQEIARRLQRLAPSHRDPFAFHEEKSELVAALRRLAANDNRTDAQKTGTNRKGYTSLLR